MLAHFIVAPASPVQETRNVLCNIQHRGHMCLTDRKECGWGNWIIKIWTYSSLISLNGNSHMRPVATEFQGRPSDSGEKIKDKVMSPTALPIQISITGLPARKREAWTRERRVTDTALEGPPGMNTTLSPETYMSVTSCGAAELPEKPRKGPLPPTAERQLCAEEWEQEGRVSTAWDHKLEEDIRGAVWCSFLEDTSERS